MIINSIPGANIATAVWTNATRTLTANALPGLGTGPLVLVSVASGSLAAATSLDLRPAAGKLREISFAITAGAAGASNGQIYDGVSARQIFTVASSANGGVGNVVGNVTVGFRCQNTDAANAAAYNYGGADWTQ